MITSVSGGSIGGNIRSKPASVSMVVVTKKKMSNRNAMSAIDPAFTSGAPALLPMIFNFYLAVAFFKAPHAIRRTATTNMIKNILIPAPTCFIPPSEVSIPAFAIFSISTSVPLASP